MHQLHAEVSGYGFDRLRQIITELKPGVLGVELTQQDLDDRKDQKIKQEYQRGVYPYIEGHRVTVFVLGPSEPQYSQRVNPSKAADRALTARAPQPVSDFSLYVDPLCGFLFSAWHSACDVNSSNTDALLAVKHRYQDALYGSQDKDIPGRLEPACLGADLWAVRHNRGKRIVVLMGGRARLLATSPFARQRGRNAAAELRFRR